MRPKNEFGDRKLFCPFFVTQILLLVAFNISYSQKIEPDKLSLNHPLNYNPQKIFPQFGISQVPDTLFVFAVRVQFKPDSNPNTTGDGRFDLSNNYPDSVDAPPHDSLYFLYHLEFLKNYYQKASKGKRVIQYQMISVVRNLDKFMYEYSPGENENLRKLGDLFFDTWKSVDSVFNFSGINPEKAAFVIFHAGVGRDVDLISQGIIQGQLDLPSVFLGLGTLKSIYGDTTQGYYTNEGNFIINNSAIIPEQEFRIIPSSFGDFFLELGMNGILVASIGSRLGLPDLFNTQTGVTAIGRFGLMDGQSIFSFSGVFPPEPSAWEKQYLGWVSPIIITSNGTYTTRAASLDAEGNSSVCKILISGKEYFLLENRNRDAFKNDLTISYRLNADTSLHTMNFTSDQDGFQNGDIWKLKGSITDVDELDWSLPGLKNDTASYQGGILIWHIDENVIDANIASNTINNNINHRGVDLDEAKGAQEIGVIINTPFGQFIGDGTYVDYWYNGFHYVPSNIYRNEFTQSTFPNSKSYTNADSRVCLRNFSTIDSSMTFNYENCSGITNINTFPRFVGIDTSGNAQPIGFDYNNNGLDEIFVNVNDTLFGFRDNGNSIRIDAPNGYLKDSASSFIVAYAFSGANQYVAGNYRNKLKLFSFTIDTSTTEPLVQSILLSNNVSSPILNTRGANGLLIGMNDGKLARIDKSTFAVTYDSLSSRKIIELAIKGPNSPWTIPYFIDDQNKFITGGNLFDPGPSDSVVVTSSNKLYTNGNIVTINQNILNIYSSPVLADINKDGNQEIIFTADDKVFAVNSYGILIDNFPFRVAGISKISSGCAVVDLNDDGIYEVIFGTADGRIYAYSVDGRVLDGFPLLAGKEIKSTPAIINSAGQFGIIVYSLDGYLYGWKTSWSYDSTRIIWRNYLKDMYHSNSNFSVFTPNVSGPCLPQDKVYNWPNPVYGNKTNIRYFLNGNPSGVKVKILDLSGELVTTLTGTNNSGFDNEVPWDVSTVQSGIYIGVVELEGGCAESVSIKIAVVK